MMLYDYLFIDEDDNVVEEASFKDNDAAENNCKRLVKKLGMPITCYRHICEYEAVFDYGWDGETYEQTDHKN